MSGTPYLDGTTEILFGQLSTLVGDEVQAFPYAYTLTSGPSAVGAAATWLRARPEPPQLHTSVGEALR